MTSQEKGLVWLEWKGMFLLYLFIVYLLVIPFIYTLFIILVIYSVSSAVLYGQLIVV